MDPISSADRIAALLKQRLLARAHTPERRTGNDPVSVRIDLTTPVKPIEPDQERSRRRRLIQNILADEFGEKLINEFRFQQVVDRVLIAIESDEAGLALLFRVT